MISSGSSQILTLVEDALKAREDESIARERKKSASFAPDAAVRFSSRGFLVRSPAPTPCLTSLCARSRLRVRFGRNTSLQVGFDGDGHFSMNPKVINPRTDILENSWNSTRRG